jgi:predicted ATPase
MHIGPIPRVWKRLVGQDRIAALPVLLLITFRPEFEPPWIGQAHVTALTLNRLGRREIAAIIDRLAGNKELSANIRHDIIERTDGIPLFVEEMTKAVVEVETEEAAERMVETVPSAGQTVPATLHASLMARLDRLGAGKDVAQIGAAIGREFSDELIAAVARKPEQELKAALDRLIEAGLPFWPGGTSAQDVFVQTRSGERRCIRHLASRQATRASRSNRFGSAARLPGVGR